ncbi:MAG TPA: TadE family protein [Alphaproteobacteria bacterium]|nr:TadE family protein [Alphaproteobacteria bacterium]
MIAWLRRVEGVTSLEFAFVLGPLLLLLMGTVEVGEVVWTQNVLNYSVEEAARCGAIDTTICGTPGQIQAYASSAAGSGISATYVASTQSCGSDVAANYTAAISAPFLNFSIPLSAHACYPK